MKFTIPFLATLAAGVSAFPNIAKLAATSKIDLARASTEVKDLLSPKVRAEFEAAVEGLKQKRDYDSIIDPNGQPFDASVQFLDVSGAHEWRAPQKGDIRGPCPGLNVLSNHGFFNRDGTVSLTQAIEVVSNVYGISPELGGVLSAYAVVFTGNILDGTWSIGGPYQAKSVLGGLTDLIGGLPEGINSHNVYEGDASVTRADYYANNGDDYTSQKEFFQQLVDIGGDDRTPGKDVYTREVLFKHRQVRFEHSIKTNPYFFYSAFGGLVVTTAAHDFIVNFMSNNTDDGNGKNRQYLDEANLFPFFSYHRDSKGKLVYTPGHERFPENWYRRPSTAPFGLADVVTNLLRSGLEDPRLLAVGGNAGKPDTFTGVQVGDLTKGLLDVTTLVGKPEALACFLYQATIQQVIPTQLKFIYHDITGALSLVNDLIGKPLGAIAQKYDPCDQLKVNANEAYSKYPGSAVGAKATKGLLGGLGDLLGGLLGGKSRRAVFKGF